MRDFSRSKIAYNFEISPYHFDMGYPDFMVRYVFSSELYRKNFIARYFEHRQKISESLSNRFGFLIEADQIADLKLYTTIEKRGFLVLIDGEPVKCVNDITLSGQRMIIGS